MSKHQAKNYTEPVLQPKNPKPSDINRDWRIRYNYFHEGKWYSLIEKKGMNYIKDYKERLAHAHKTIGVLKIKLGQQGWNPVTNTYPAPKTLTVDQELLQLKELTFSKALLLAAKKKGVDWGHKTKQDYASVIKYLQQAASSLAIADKKIAEFKLPHYKLVLEEAKALRNLSAKGFNKYREYLSSLVTELVDWEVVELNYVHHVKSKQTIKVFSHRPPTQDQRELIIGRIKTQYRDYYRFLCVLYGCTLRPKEITRLKIKDLHKKEQVFRLVPDTVEENSKVKFEREITIPDWVMDILSEMNLHTFDPDFYVFSTRNKYGSFLPGKNRMHSNTPTKWWHNIVKVDLKLDVNQYSLKKLSGNDMVKIQRMEGVDKLLDLPQSQMGHTTSKQTETYVTEHLEVMKELVKKRMPVL